MTTLEELLARPDVLEAGSLGMKPEWREQRVLWRAWLIHTHVGRLDSGLESCDTEAAAIADVVRQLDERR